MGGTYQYYTENWAHEVKRFLYARIDSIWEKALGNTSLESSEVSKFLESLSIDSIRLVLQDYHISQEEGGYDFVFNTLPDYIASLSNVIELFSEQSYFAKGRIIWNKTMISRAMGNQNILVIENKQKSHASPENQLLVLYLTALANIISDIDENSDNIETGHRKLFSTCQQAKQLLRMSNIRSIPLPEDVTPQMIHASYRSKRSVYQAVARLWMEFEQTVLSPQRERVKDVLERGWIRPSLVNGTDDLFELYVLVSSINVVEKYLIDQKVEYTLNYNPIHPGANKPIAIFCTKEHEIVIRYDKSLAIMASGEKVTSEYLMTIEQYEGLSGKSRRPDVQIICSEKGRGHNVFTLIIEAKNTGASSSYANDSIYKCMGYLRDYSAVWNNSQTPKIVLALPYGVKNKLSSVKTYLDKDIVIVSDGLIDSLYPIIAKMGSFCVCAPPVQPFAGGIA